MEIIPGPSNWLLTARREAGGVTLLRCATPDTDAVLPETLWGLPVTALADHALAPHPTDEKSADVRITCGNPGNHPWDNSALQTLTLPPALGRVENYALYHCRALKRLRLHDGVSFWGSGVLTGCPVLQWVEILQFGGNPQSVGKSQSVENPQSVGKSQSPKESRQMKELQSARDSANRLAPVISPGGTLAYLAGELNHELDVTVSTSDGPLLRLIFPAYRESYEENTPAHHFDYVIEGAGYPYHHCFRSRVLHLPTYDSLWPRFRESEDSCAVRLAWRRLRYPVELSAKAEYSYWDYLHAHDKETISWLMRERDIEGLAFYLERGKHGRDLSTYALDLARELRFTEAVALLLEEQRCRAPVRDRFAL